MLLYSSDRIFTDLTLPTDLNNLGSVLQLCRLSTSAYLFPNCSTITITLASLSAMEQREVVASQAHLVSLLSVCNCLGRLAAGFSSDYMTHHCPNHMRFARIWWYVPTAVLFTISQLVASHANSVEGWRGLGLPTALTGFAYGSLFAISPVICLERFGIRSFGLNNGLLTLAPSVFGALLVSLPSSRQHN